MIQRTSQAATESLSGFRS